MTFDTSKRQLYNVENRQRYLFYNNKQYLNLSSNDYLGLSSLELQNKFMEEVSPLEKFVMSNPSSRLMTGNSVHYENLEKSIASLFGRESSLVVSCGFLLNATLISAIAAKNSLIIADKLVHASMIDGIKLSGCDFERFRHNDTNHLAQILERKATNYDEVYVMVESIYSMDGDIAPIKEIAELKNEYGFKFYVDEAHAFGVRGEKGCGILEELDMENCAEIVVATLGKAAASQGGFVVCSNEIKDVLINKMRGLIFSTAIPDISLMWSKFIVELLPSLTEKRENLAKLSTKLTELLNIKPSPSHIIPIILGSNDRVVQMQESLRDKGYWLAAIRNPTVAKGSERLRISLSAEITTKELELFAENYKKSTNQL
ncbi:MAG: 8-amino-7-oxononanoate synthase [Rikenellaceae bacterium]